MGAASLFAPTPFAPNSGPHGSRVWTRAGLCSARRLESVWGLLTVGTAHVVTLLALSAKAHCGVGSLGLRRWRRVSRARGRDAGVAPTRAAAAPGRQLGPHGRPGSRRGRPRVAPAQGGRVAAGPPPGSALGGPHSAASSPRRGSSAASRVGLPLTPGPCGPPIPGIPGIIIFRLNDRVGIQCPFRGQASREDSGRRREECGT